MSLEAPEMACTTQAIKLISSDGKAFELKPEFVKKVNMLKQMLADLGHSEEEGNYPDEGIPLPSVAGEALEKIVEWLTLNEAEKPKTEEHRFNRNVQKKTSRSWISAARAPSLPTLSTLPTTSRSRISSTPSPSTPLTTWQGRQPRTSPRGSTFF